jgi:hypothetical protein
MGRRKARIDPLNNLLEMLHLHSTNELKDLIEHHMPLEFPDPIFDEMHFDMERRFIAWRQDEKFWYQGEVDDKFKSYDGQGILFSKDMLILGNFKLGVPHGVCISLTTDMCRDESFIDGREEGQCITTFKNGTRITETFVNGTITNEEYTYG